jgi:hypothetical protein
MGNSELSSLHIDLTLLIPAWALRHPGHWLPYNGACTGVLVLSALFIHIRKRPYLYDISCSNCATFILPLFLDIKYFFQEY